MKKSLFIFVGLAMLVFAVAFATTSMAKSDKSNDKSSKVKELKNFEKPTSQKTNSAIHKEKIAEVAAELKEVADEEKNKGQQKREENTNEKKINNPDVGKQENKRAKTSEEIAEDLEEAAEEAEESEVDTVEAIAEIEEQSGFKKFLVGTDYKNLGQLRSSLVHNRNQIKKLATLSLDVTDEETKAAIEAQLTILMQERERIKTVISDNEDGFSLLGWAFRLMNGYPKDSIDEQEEEELEEEVSEVLEGDVDAGEEESKAGDEVEGGEEVNEEVVNETSAEGQTEVTTEN